MLMENVSKGQLLRKGSCTVKNRTKSRLAKSKNRKARRARRVRKTKAVAPAAVIPDPDREEAVVEEQADVPEVVGKVDTPEFIDPEPWDQPVSGEAMMAEILSVIRRHMIVPAFDALAVALWVVYAYLYDVFSHAPFLALMSPTMRCGKTTALTLVGALTPRPASLAHVTGAALFRLIHENHPTVLIDEVDLAIRRSKDLRMVLNTSHSRHTAFIPRIVNGVTVRFQVFSAKVLACIGTLPDTQQDRSIVIALQRKRPDEKVEPLPRNPAETYGDTTRRIARWARDYRHIVAAQPVPIPAGLNDRAADNWRPLLAIADTIGPQWVEMARQAAVKISRAADFESVDPAEQLIRDVARVFDAARGATEIPTGALHKSLVEIEGGMWAEFERGQPLTKARLGRILSQFRIHSTVARVRGRAARASKVTRVYRRADFEDVFSRYVPKSPAA